MKYFILYFILSILSFSHISCSQKDNYIKIEKETINSDEEILSDSLTPAENFALAMIQDVLQDEQEIDLQLYLEEEIFPLISKSELVTIDKVYSSMYLLKYISSGIERNILIQKYYNPNTGEIKFEKSDITINNINLLTK